MRTIQETDAPLIELSKPKELSHGMQLYRVQSDGPFTFKVSVSIPFTPSAFQGTGEEERVGIVMSIPQDAYDRIASFSESFKKQLSEKHPDIGQKWNGSLKPATDQYAPTLRAKINLKGDKQCQFYDLEGQSCSAPSQWRRLDANVVLRLGGVYH